MSLSGSIPQCASLSELDPLTQISLNPLSISTSASSPKYLTVSFFINTIIDKQYIERKKGPKIHFIFSPSLVYPKLWGKRKSYKWIVKTNIRSTSKFCISLGKLYTKKTLKVSHFFRRESIRTICSSPSMNILNAPPCQMLLFKIVESQRDKIFTIAKKCSFLTQLHVFDICGNRLFVRWAKTSDDIHQFSIKNTPWH